MTALYPKHALPIGFQIGGYSIVRVIGQGGFGIVYEAYNSDTEHRVAIKEYYPSSLASRREGTIVINHDDDREMFEKVLSRYRSTALMQLKFDHPNILKVYDYVRATSTGYMITEFVEGETLSAIWARHGGRAPSYELFQAMLQPAINALAYLHSKGFIHRDIAPDNIMWTKSGRSVLIDFGAVKESINSATHVSSVVVLKEDYSPPEQQVPDKLRPMGFYTDIFALAGTMYTGLAGKPPAGAMSRALTQGNDLYVPIAKATRISAPERVYAAIDKALSIPIQQRPRDMAEFSNLLGWDGDETLISFPAKLSPDMANILEDVPPRKNSEERKSSNIWMAATAVLVTAFLLIGGYFGYRAYIDTTITESAQEQRTFIEARGNIELLRKYARDCKVCEFRNEANAAIADQERAILEASETQQFKSASGNPDALRTYAANCKVCAHKAEAEAALASLKKETSSSTPNVAAAPLRNENSVAAPSVAASPFDGTWEVVTFCPDTKGAKAYTQKYAATVKDGLFSAERGNKGKPGYLIVKGKINSDGTARLFADGLTNDPTSTVGNPLPGSPYSFFIQARFDKKFGTGTRTIGRKCDVSFEKIN